MVSLSVADFHRMIWNVSNDIQHKTKASNAYKKAYENVAKIFDKSDARRLSISYKYAKFVAEVVGDRGGATAILEEALSIGIDRSDRLTYLADQAQLYLSSSNSSLSEGVMKAREMECTLNEWRQTRYSNYPFATLGISCTPRRGPGV